MRFFRNRPRTADLSRRTFLKQAPVAAVGAGMAAGAVAEKMAGVGVVGEGKWAFQPGQMAAPSLGSISSPMRPNGSAIAKILRHVGFPDWKRQEMRAFASRHRVLDPDIATMHSWSLSMKLAEQTQRNIAALEREEIEGLLRSEARDKWHAEHGFRL